MAVFRAADMSIGNGFADHIEEINEKDINNNQKREKWSNKVQFVLACIGYSVGLNNIWRFPYVAYENGGGAFQIAYLVILILVGIPTYVMEIGIGQFSSKGPLGIWKCCPVGIGVGRAMMIITLLPRFYMNVLISYTLIYMGSSFTRQLPWQQCEEWWGADENCFVRDLNAQNDFNTTMNLTTNDNKNVKEVAAKQFWERFVLNLNATEGVNDFSTMEWKVVVSLAISILCIYLSIFKGIKSLGKVVYFTALFPYVILLAFVVQSLMLDGATEGLYYFFVPTWEKILEINTWMNAARQVFFSLGVGTGIIINLSSHNSFQNNFYKNSIFIGFLDFFTSILGSVIVFSVLGMLSKSLNVPISQVFSGGQGLAFITFPEATTKLPVPQFWSFAFFFMLYTLGINSTFVGFDAFLNVMINEYPILKNYKKWLYIVSMFIIFCLGLPFATPGGHYLLMLLDVYNVFTRATITAVEIVFIMWIYGYNNFYEDIKFMLGSYPNRYLRLCWTFVSPVTIIGLSVMSFANYKAPKYGKYQFPDWAHAIGWVFVAVILLQVPIGAIIVLYKYWKKGNIMGAFQPSAEWGPCLSVADIRISSNNDLSVKETTKI